MLGGRQEHAGRMLVRDRLYHPHVSNISRAHSSRRKCPSSMRRLAMPSCIILLCLMRALLLVCSLRCCRSFLVDPANQQSLAT